MADEYVPVGGWEAAGYGSFGSGPIQNTGTTYQNGNVTTTTMPAPSYYTVNGNYQPQQPAPQQSLLPYQGSYSELRGWNPDPMAANNSGPALGGGSWGFDGGKGGLLSDAYQYPNGRPTASSTPSPYGALPSYNDWLTLNKGTDNQQFRDIYKSTVDPTGGASNGSLYPGGDYNDQFNAPYTNPYGDLPAAVSQNPYGDLSGSQPANPYGDLSGSQPSNPYGNLSGVPAMQPPSPYGDLSNSQPQNPYGSLSNAAATGGAQLGLPSFSDWFQANKAAFPGGDTAQAQAIYKSTVGDLPSAGATPASGSADGLLSGGAGLGAGPDANPTYGNLSGVPPMQPSNLYGNLNVGGQFQDPAGGATLGSSAATGGAQLPSYQDWLGFNKGTDNATYQDIYRKTIDSSFQNPAQSYQMPGQQYGLLNSQQSEAPITNTTDYTGGAGLLGGTQTAYAGQFPAGVAYGGSDSTPSNFNQLPQTSSPYDQVGQEVGSNQYSSYPLDRSQVPASVVPKGTSLEDLPFPNDAERLRLMRTVNGEDPKNPEAVLWSIKNRLATQQQPNEAPYGNTIGTGVEPLNNGTSVVTRGNQYNAFSPAGYNESNYANNVEGFNESNPNYQRYSDAIDGVWGGNIPDPTAGATNYYNPGTSAPAWQQQLAQQNFQPIGAHNYVGQTPLYTPPLPPPRPDYLNPSPLPTPTAGGDRYSGLLGGGEEMGYRSTYNNQ